MDKIALGYFELAVFGFDFDDIRFDTNVLYFGGDVVHGDVAGTRALRRGDEVAGALVRDANQVGSAARLVQRVMAAGIGGRVGHLAHARLDIDEHYRITGSGFVRGFVGHGSADRRGLGESACKEHAQSYCPKSQMQFHGRLSVSAW